MLAFVIAKTANPKLNQERNMFRGLIRCKAAFKKITAALNNPI